MFLTLLATSAMAGPGLRFPGPLGPVAHERPAPVRVDALPRAEPVPASPKSDRNGFGQNVAAAARTHLKRYPSGFRNDCSGFVMAAYAEAGHPISGSTRTLWEDAKRQKSTHTKNPRVGDIAFFDDTYDRNRNGKRDDDLTHVGVVIEVEDDGTVVIAHAGTSKGRSTLRMNVRQATLRADEDGRILNDWLRARRSHEPRDGAYLAGQLFRGYARFQPAGS